MVKNCAFVFLKPHAVTDKVKELVSKRFEEQSITVQKEGSLLAEDIDKKKLIDSHYYAIASKATLLKPTQLNIPKDKFKEFFGLEWDAAVKDDKVFNAMDACEKLGLTADELDKEWANTKKNKKLVKFGGGFYCGLVEVKGKEPIYVFNGFFMSMRAKFVEPGTSIYYYVVEWDQEALAWEDFRGKVLGPTDPVTAPPTSLRGEIFKDWKSLGLAYVPNVGDNAVHASASPFEALAERINWLGYRPHRDAFGKQLLKVATRAQIKEWCNDPQVTYGPMPIKKSLYDSLEDTDTDYCLALCQMIAAGVPKSKVEKTSELEAENARLKEQLRQYDDLAIALKTLVGFKPHDDEYYGQQSSSSRGKGRGKGKGKGGRGRY